MKRLRVAIGTLALAVLVNGGIATSAWAQTDPATSTTPTDQAALEAAVRAYSAAFLGGDAKTARQLLSTKCQAKLKQKVLTATVKAVHKKYADAQIRSVKVVSFAPTKAKVTYRYDKKVLDATKEPWVNKNGVWLRDC